MEKNFKDTVNEVYEAYIKNVEKLMTMRKNATIKEEDYLEELERVEEAYIENTRALFKNKNKYSQS